MNRLYPKSRIYELLWFDTFRCIACHRAREWKPRLSSPVQVVSRVSSILTNTSSHRSRIVSRILILHGFVDRVRWGWYDISLFHLCSSALRAFQVWKLAQQSRLTASFVHQKILSVDSYYESDSRISVNSFIVTVWEPIYCTTAQTVSVLLICIISCISSHRYMKSSDAAHWGRGHVTVWV